MLNVHWCCGDVYLDGYINLDISGTLISDVSVNPNKTTLDNYYAHPFDINFARRERRIFIVDCIANIMERWPFENETVSKIVMISCWEHFTKEQVQHILCEIKRVLKVGGKLIVDFPDLKKDLELYLEADPEYCMELIYCNWKNEFSCHKWGYTARSFAMLWDDRFLVQKKTYVQHDYPMIGMEVEKVHD